jgi:transcriptional regulator with XRE-family HTH domain
MKQIEMAKKLGISKSYLSMILSGKRKPTGEVLKALSSQNLVNFHVQHLLYTQGVIGSSPLPPTIY